jgi:hypothetical protein
MHAKDVRDSKLAPVVTVRAQVETEIERLEEQRSEDGISRATIEELLALDIVDTGERDPNADEDFQGSGSSRNDLRNLAVSILTSGDTDRVSALSAAVVDEVARYARGLDISVYLHPNPKRPMWPNLRVEFNPEGLTSIRGSAWRNGCRGGGGTGIHPVSVRRRRNAARS